MDKRGLRAAFVGKDHRKSKKVSLIVTELVFISPESVLCVLQYREMFLSETYQEYLMCLAIDEAHCVGKWYVNSLGALLGNSLSYMHIHVCFSHNVYFFRGESFRSAFANTCISEIRALAPLATNLMALTATANSHTRDNVIKALIWFTTL